MMEFDRPVIVTGAPRSGKSLLTKILRQSPQFGFLMEPLSIWDVGMAGRPDDRRTAEEATERVSSRIRASCHAHLRELGKQRYLDDLSYHALRIPFLRRVMPEARIVHVYRSGREIVPQLLYGWTFRDSIGRSFKRRRRTLTLTALPRLGLRFARNYIASRLRGRRLTWGPRVPGLAEFAATHTTAEVAAFQWRRMVEIARQDMAQLPPGVGMEITLEELVADPAETARRLAAFAEVEDEAPLVSFACELIKSDFVFERNVWPSAEEWTRIHAIIDPLERELGYASPPPAADAGPAGEAAVVASGGGGSSADGRSKAGDSSSIARPERGT